MTMRPFSNQVVVGVAAPVRIFAFRPVDFHSVTIRNDAAHADFLYIGAGGVSSGDGFTLAGGESVSFTHRDFDVMRLRPGELVEVYGISGGAVGTTVYVFGFTGGL